MAEDRFGVNLYFSGDVDEDVELYLLAGDVHRLHSYAYPKYAFKYLDLAESLGKRAKMIIDSGAFTSWSIGKPVVFDELMAYNDKLLNLYGDRHEFHFISLDVIPGERGRRATSDEIHAAVDQSYQNYLTMNAHYPNHYVLPVYHSGEDVGLRDAYLKITDYVCLSMDQGMAEKNRLEWAKRASAVAGAKFHGLAATGNRMVTQVPWFSVDSSSWLTVSNMGGLLWPNSKGGFRVLSVSKESPSRHDAGAHITTLAPVERQAIIDYIQQCGFDWESMREHYKERRKWNAFMWMNTPWRTQVDPATDLWSTAC